MFFSYKNCKISIDDNPIFAQKIAVSWQGKPEPAYTVDKKYNNYYTPTDGINGTLSISYLLTGVDTIANYIINDNTPINIDFGGLHIQSGYLRKYGFNASPNSPVIINADIIFFDSLTGHFFPTYEIEQEQTFLNISDVNISAVQGGNSIGSISNVTKFNYQYDAPIYGMYEVGKTIPSRVVIGQKNISVDFSSDKINGFIPVSGNKVALKAVLVHPFDSGIFQNFDCRGVVYQKNLDTSSNSILDSSYFIRQNDLSSFNINYTQAAKKPVIYSFSPTTGFYGTIISISGKNLSYTNDISYKDVVYDSNFQIVNDSQINTMVPDDAISGPITLYSELGSTVSNKSFLIGGRPISISGLSSYYQTIGQKILISGANFYEISRVLFNNNIESSFTRISPSIIEAKVPSNSSFGKIKVISDVFSLSGQSNYEFVPSPNIIGFSPLSGLSGQIVTISGQAFSGITGVKFNNLPSNGFAAFTVLDNNNISVSVPSGNTRGYIKLYAQSGVSSQTTFNFFPYAKTTSVLPSSGRTGTAITISGSNIVPEILFPFGNSVFAVLFNGGVTGYFTRKNNATLTGVVPSGATSGILHLSSPLSEEYPSDVSFNVRYNSPSIDYIDSSSGKFNDVVSVIGTNFYNVNSITLSGVNTGNKITSNFSVSNTNDFINFIVPNITGGKYSVLVNANEGTASGYNLLTILEKPYLSGLSLTSGGANREIFVSGRNLYNNITKIYIDNTGVPAALNSGSFLNDNKLSFYLPSNLSSGNHQIIIDNTVSGLTGLQNFQYIPNPSISGFSPYSGEWGDLIKVSGLFFSTISGVSIDGTTITGYTIIGNTGLQFRLPTVNTDYLTLTNFGGQTVSNTSVIINTPKIIISGFKPNPLYFNSGVVVSGSYLNTAKQIIFSGANSGEISITNFSGVGTTGLQFIVPVGITSGYLKILNSRGYSYSSYPITLIPNPVIGYINRNTGVYGDTIVISGQNLSGSIPYFASFNNTLLTGDNISRIGDTGIQCTVPHEIISDRIAVRGRNYNIVKHSGIFNVLPTISGISGNLTYATGSYITITGINAYEAIRFLGFSGTDGNYYDLLNGTGFINDAIYATGISNFKTGYCLITAKIGTGFAGTGRVFLGSSLDLSLSDTVSGSMTVTNYKNSVIYNTGVVISQPSPIITSFTPTGGSQNTLVTIVGSHFLSANNIIFNIGASFGTGVIYTKSNNIITVYPQLNTTGTGLFYVSSPFGTAQTGRFKILPVINISGYNPTSAHTGEYVRISGSGLGSITGVSFGSYNASFNKYVLNNTIIISGIVPDDFDCCGETVQICVTNEGDNYCL